MTTTQPNGQGKNFPVCFLLKKQTLKPLESNKRNKKRREIDTKPKADDKFSQ